MFCYYVKFFFPVLPPFLDLNIAVHVPAPIQERGTARVDLAHDVLQIAGIDSLEPKDDGDEAIALFVERDETVEDIPLSLEEINEILGWLALFKEF